MPSTIALVGNPNSGKTTLFNQLTGNHQYVGNWPGVTVERKSGELKDDSDTKIIDLPGIYSLTPYSSEEIVARDYLESQDSDVIVNIVDASNLERNLYLTIQLMEFGTPIVVALNQMDIIRKRGYTLDSRALQDELGIPVVEISALQGSGIDELITAAKKAATEKKAPEPRLFPSEIEDLLAHLEMDLPDSVEPHLKRYHCIKYLEGDKRVIEQHGNIGDIAQHIHAVEVRFDDQVDAVIANERYNYITSFIDRVQKRPHKAAQNNMTSKIDKVLLNRVAAIPIFLAIIVAIYYISVSTVGTVATDWANDGVFGDGWYLDPIAIVDPAQGAQGALDEATEPYEEAQEAIASYLEAASDAGIETGLVAANYLDEPSEDLVASLGETFERNPDSDEARTALAQFESEAAQADLIVEYTAVDEDESTETDYFIYPNADFADEAQELADARNEQIEAEGRSGAAEATIYCFDGETIDEETGETVVQGIKVPAPEDPSAYGLWIPGVPVIVGGALESAGCPDWLYNLIVDGIIAGVGAVLGFVPQIMILFFLLAILEGCGYMARVTFILDRIFRRFGLSGKTFIPMIIGTGCGVPGIMASRTIESESSRRLTIMTTTFMPCSAKLPIIALISTAIFGGTWWVAPLAYVMGIASIVISGIILKKTKPFRGKATPYIMELPEYRAPRFVDLLRSMWDRAWAFIKKAGTIILAATVIVWFLSGYGIYEGQFMWVGETLMDHSFLAAFGNAFAWLFGPLGFANWQAASTVVTGLIAKENVIGTMAVIFGGSEVTWSAAFMQSLAVTAGSPALVHVAAFSFMTFQLLCAPCFAAMGAIKREMGGFNKWFWAAIGWECGWAYAIALIIFQIGSLAILGSFTIGTVAAFALIALIIFGLFRPLPKTAMQDDDGLERAGGNAPANDDPIVIELPADCADSSQCSTCTVGSCARKPQTGKTQDSR